MAVVDIAAVVAEDTVVDEEVKLAVVDDEATVEDTEPAFVGKRVNPNSFQKKI